MSNYKLELDRWMARYPLQEESYGGFYANSITAPEQLCHNEQLRRELQGQFNWGRSVPVDVFVMAEGEPIDRHVTKIGGLPYRPSKSAWPTGKDGTEAFEEAPSGDFPPQMADEPMIFIGQLNFLDSKDITGELPGDVLLLFASWDFSRMFLEWQPLGITELASASDVPRTPYSVIPCYGYIFRTMSYPEAAKTGGGDPTCRGIKVDDWDPLLQYQATQIGRAPYYVQEIDAGERYRPLCTINSVVPGDTEFHPPEHRARHSKVEEAAAPPPDTSFDMEWISTDDPRVHNYHPMHHPITCHRDFLMIADNGCIYVFVDDNGKLIWVDAYY